MECIIDFSGRNWCRKEKNPEKNQAKKIKDFRIFLSKNSIVPINQHHTLFVNKSRGFRLL